MFRRKKLYKFVYEKFQRHTTIIEAKDEYQALKKFKKEVKCFDAHITIISFEEYKLTK